MISLDLLERQFTNGCLSCQIAVLILKQIRLNINESKNRETQFIYSFEFYLLRFKKYKYVYAAVSKKKGFKVFSHEDHYIYVGFSLKSSFVRVVQDTPTNIF